MQVVNILKDGTVVNDMSKITVPEDSQFYDVVRGFHDRHNNEDSDKKEKRV